jgi:hypothetical protein
MMIFRQFPDAKNGDHSYLVAACDSRVAAIINPATDRMAEYVSMLAELNLQLQYTLETRQSTTSRRAAAELSSRTGSRQVIAAGTLSADEANSNVVEAKEGGHVELGQLRVKFVAALNGDSQAVAYQAHNYTFDGNGVLIEYNSTSEIPSGEPEYLFDHIRPANAVSPAHRRRGPIRSFRVNRRDVKIEQLILEDLNTSFAERRFTPKEERLILAYIRYMEDHQFTQPSAAELSGVLQNVDRTAIHVLVHNIRWKQIDLDRMPLILQGQTSKWLKGLQTEPEFTSHEQEFLGAYLHLVEKTQQPPTGPDIASRLGESRSVQWVRKRAHTIRRKQRAFQKPVLILSRKNNPRDGMRDTTSGKRELEPEMYLSA